MILKILGATRKDILLAWIFEYSLLAILTAVIAMLIGTAISWALIDLFIGGMFFLNLPLISGTALLGAAATICLGLIGAVHTLGTKPGPFLRETL